MNETDQNMRLEQRDALVDGGWPSDIATHITSFVTPVRACAYCKKEFLYSSYEICSCCHTFTRICVKCRHRTRTTWEYCWICRKQTCKNCYSAVYSLCSNCYQPVECSLCSRLCGLRFLCCVSGCPNYLCNICTRDWQYAGEGTYRSLAGCCQAHSE